MFNSGMSPLYRPSFILLTLVFFILFTIVMRLQGKPLQTTVSPLGIVEMEFAYSAQKATTIKKEWSSINKGNNSLLQVALYNTLIDFIYIASYGLFLIFFCLRSAKILNNKKTMSVAAFLAFLAGAFDVLENFGMLYTLQKHILPIITTLTCISAIIKFSFLAVVVLLLIFCWGKRFSILVRSKIDSAFAK